MAKKKIYAVRKGHTTGIFDNWTEAHGMNVKKRCMDIPEQNIKDF